MLRQWQLSRHDGPKREPDARSANYKFVPNAMIHTLKAFNIEAQGKPSDASREGVALGKSQCRMAVERSIVQATGPSPRPQQSLACFGLGRAAIDGGVSSRQAFPFSILTFPSGSRSRDRQDCLGCTVIAGTARRYRSGLNR
jgi:hypothetical protein